MDAQKLMIGDWVYNTYHRKNIQWSYSEMFCPNGNPVIGKDLKPVPLTPEILEKNVFAFRKDNDTMCGVYYLHNQSTFAIKMFNGHLVGMCMGEDLEFHYVHELQHALRLCGLDDLANNFQID